MIPEKATVLVFSPTGTSKKSAAAVARGLGCPVEILDLTVPGAAAPRAFGPDEVVVLGTPCYSGRVPQLAMSRLAGFTGDHTPCIVTVTFGNRHFDDALAELCDFCQNSGFVPVAGAAMVAQHTFGQIAVGRPTAEDEADDTAFGQKVAQALETGIVDRTGIIPGNRPYKDGGSGGKFRPSTLDTCVSCGLCRKNCPAGAIGDDNRTIDNEKCLSCFRCIALCPKKAKAMRDPGYDAFCVKFNEMLAQRQENRYFL